MFTDWIAVKDFTKKCKSLMYITHLCSTQKQSHCFNDLHTCKYRLLSTMNTTLDATHLKQETLNTRGRIQSFRTPVE